MFINLMSFFSIKLFQVKTDNSKTKYYHLDNIGLFNEHNWNQINKLKLFPTSFYNNHVSHLQLLLSVKSVCLLTNFIFIH